MAPKVVLFLVATLLLVSTQVFSNDDKEYRTKALTTVKPSVPVAAPDVPVKAPAPAPPVSPPTKPMPKIRTIADCVPLCGERCKAHSRQNVCKRACQTCCVRCKCVPPGTYGNREMCGTCYTGMMSRNRPKCP